LVDDEIPLDTSQEGSGSGSDHGSRKKQKLEHVKIFDDQDSDSS
jgi:hypothetical protein